MDYGKVLHGSRFLAFVSTSKVCSDRTGKATFASITAAFAKPKSRAIRKFRIAQAWPILPISIPHPVTRVCAFTYASTVILMLDGSTPKVTANLRFASAMVRGIS